MCLRISSSSQINNGIFKRSKDWNSTVISHARAADSMSTQSATGFEWSIKLIGDTDFYVGIASRLERDQLLICERDVNAILYHSNGNSPVIQCGTRVMHSDLLEQITGDVIHFKFQPQTKKLVIELVRHFYRFE